MKIGYFISGGMSLHSPRGDSVHIRSFIKNISKIGVNIFLVRNRAEESKPFDFKIYNLKWRGQIPRFRKLLDLLYNFKLYRAGSSIIKQEKPDILYEREILLNISVSLLARKYRIPYVLEVNAPLLNEVKWRPFLPFKTIERFLEQKKFKSAKKIVVVSNVLKEHLVNRGVAEDKIAVAIDGADSEMFNPQIPGRLVRKKYQLIGKEVVGFAGSLHQEWQGIDEILQAAKKLSVVRESLVFLIVGGSREEVERLKKAASPNVILTGQVGHDEVPNYLAAADILAAPYKLKKGFEDIGFYNSPIKLFEYMAMGKPIITSELGQMKEIFTHEESCMFIEPGNHEDLIRKILSLLDNEQLREKLGRNAWETFEKNFTWEHNVKRIKLVFEEALGQH